jgi:hypothetical protein
VHSGVQRETFDRQVTCKPKAPNRAAEVALRPGMVRISMRWRIVGRAFLRSSDHLIVDLWRMSSEAPGQTGFGA